MSYIPPPGPARSIRNKAYGGRRGHEGINRSIRSKYATIRPPRPGDKKRPQVWEPPMGAARSIRHKAYKNLSEYPQKGQKARGRAYQSSPIPEGIPPRTRQQRPREQAYHQPPLVKPGERPAAAAGERGGPVLDVPAIAPPSSHAPDDRFSALERRFDGLLAKLAQTEERATETKHAFDLMLYKRGHKADMVPHLKAAMLAAGLDEAAWFKDSPTAADIKEAFGELVLGFGGDEEDDSEDGNGEG